MEMEGTIDRSTSLAQKCGIVVVPNVNGLRIGLSLRKQPQRSLKDVKVQDTFIGCASVL